MRSLQEIKPGVKRKEFAAYTPGEARTAASQWLGNFKDHPPLDIKSIRIFEERDLFVAAVVYSEMTVEETPQHFPNYQPQFKKAS